MGLLATAGYQGPGHWDCPVRGTGAIILGFVDCRQAFLAGAVRGGSIPARVVRPCGGPNPRLHRAGHKPVASGVCVNISAKTVPAAGIGLIPSVFAANLAMEAQPRRIRAATQMVVRPCPKDDGIARPWPNGDGARFSCTSPDSPKRRSPTRSAWTAPSFPAICKSVRDSVCTRESPDVQEACSTQMAKLDPLEHTHWVCLDRSKVVKKSCTTLHIPEHAYTSQHNSGTCRHLPAHFCATLESPSQKRKPLCEGYLHRWIRCCFTFRGGRQAGLGQCRQGIEVKRLPRRREPAAETGALRKNWALPVLGAKLSS